MGITLLTLEYNVFESFSAGGGLHRQCIMTRRLPITQAREELTSLPERLAEEPDTVMVVTRRRKPVLAILPWELYEGLLETLEIMADPELMAELRKSLEQADRGETIPWEQIEAELDRRPRRSR